MKRAMNVTHLLLSLGVIFLRKDDGQKCSKRHKVKHTELVHNKHIFFVLSSVHAIGKTDSTNYSVLL